jgi:hypothetical protein
MTTPTATTEGESLKREMRAIGVEAYFYVYPLVTMEITRRQTTNLPSGTKPGFGPLGVFSHIREFLTADFRDGGAPDVRHPYSSA